MPHVKTAKKKLLTFLMFFCVFFLYSQEVLTEENSQGQFNSINTLYRIASANYNSQGMTKETALKRNIKIEEGKIFESKEEFDAYILDIKQKLINARLFESSQVECFFEETTTSENGEQIVNVAVNVETVDSKHFLLLPYPKYSSNDGLEIGIILKDDNFLGTMSELSGSTFFLFEQKENQDNDYVLGGELRYAFPFSIGPVLASWNNDWAFKNAFVREEQEWNLKTGFTFLLPFERFGLQLDLEQGTTRDLEYSKFDDELYFTEYAKFSVPIKLETIKGFGDIIYTPAAEILYNWDTNDIDIEDEDLVSPELTFSHTLSAGRIDWHGNFRKGFSASIGQSAAYNFQLEEFQPGVSLKLQGHYSWKKVGINSRYMLFAEYNSYKRYGKLLRGIPDDQYFAEETGKGDIYACKSAATMIFNLDLPIHILTTDWEKIGWDWLHSFNFEMQISPFIDVALTQNRITERVFDPRDGFYACGVELLLFPENWKSVQLRASIGFDVGRIFFEDELDTSWRSEKAGKREITIGFGVFY